MNESAEGATHPPSSNTNGRVPLAAGATYEAGRWAAEAKRTNEPRPLAWKTGACSDFGSRLLPAFHERRALCWVRLFRQRLDSDFLIRPHERRQQWKLPEPKIRPNGGRRSSLSPGERAGVRGNSVSRSFRHIRSSEGKTAAGDCTHSKTLSRATGAREVAPASWSATSPLALSECPSSEGTFDQPSAARV